MNFLPELVVLKMKKDKKKLQARKANSVDILEILVAISSVRHSNVRRIAKNMSKFMDPPLHL